MTKLEALAKDCIENHTHRLIDRPSKQDIYTREESIYISGYKECERQNKNKIIELEQKLEQTEKDLTDYQFNYPKIKDLEKENALLKGRNKGFEQQIMGLLIKYEEVYKRFPDLKSAMDKAQTILKENAELKEHIKADCIDCADYIKNQKLEKENAELKIKNKNADSLNNKLEEDNYNLTCNLNATLDRLNEATELLKATLLMAQVEGLKVRYETVDDIEQFLKDCDIDNAIQQANKGLDFDKITDEMEQDLKDSEVEK